MKRSINDNYISRNFFSNLMIIDISNEESENNIEHCKFKKRKSYNKYQDKFIFNTYVFYKIANSFIINK